MGTQRRASKSDGTIQESFLDEVTQTEFEDENALTRKRRGEGEYFSNST